MTNFLQQICSEPAGWAAILGWVLYAISEAVGANRKLKDNTALGFFLHAAKTLLPVEVQVKPRTRTRRRDEHGRFAKPEE
jgi:hypothetical protein